MTTPAPVLDCLVNGELSSFVSVDDRGLALADGLVERIAVRGGHPLWWQDHMDRLARGCERLGLLAPQQSVLLRELQTVTAGRSRCIVRILLTRGIGSGLAIPPEDEETVPTRVVLAYPWPEGLQEQARFGVRVRTCALRLAVQPALGGISHINRLEWALAARELRQHPDVEGLMLDANEHLISGIESNLFIVAGGQLLTPRMDRSGVRGIVRGRIIREFKARCELRRITPDMLGEADEVFFCDVVRGIVPVRAIDAQEFDIGPVTRELQDWLAERQERA